MKSQFSIWLEFGVILVATGTVVFFCYFSLLRIRWHYRKRRMKRLIAGLDRDPQMHICADETKIMLDTKVGEFRNVVLS